LTQTESPNGKESKENGGAAGPRDRILQAALDLFVDQGYFNTNVPDISRRSKCSVGSIYHHFLNKEEIAGQLYKDGIKQFRNALASAVETEADLEKTIRNTVIAFMTFAEQNEKLSRYLWLARHKEFINKELSRPTVVGFDQLGRRLTVAIKNAIRSGEIPDQKAEVIWSVVFGIPQSFITDWLDGYTTETPSAVAPTLAEACWAALHWKSAKKK
jgi:AcrR family transcriptional regulator